MLNPTAFIGRRPGVLCDLGFLYMEAERAGPQTGCGFPRYHAAWIKRFENISGPGILVYSITMTAAVIYWVMSLDPTWYSSVYGLLFLVGQGYMVLALGIITAISWPRYAAAGTRSRPAPEEIAAAMETASNSTRAKLRAQLEAKLHDWMDELAQVRILDPACGSGNFLYLALKLLLDLWKETQSLLHRSPSGLPALQGRPLAALRHRDQRLRA